MSEEYEKKVVALEFDNSKFDSRMRKSRKTLEKFKKSLRLDDEIRSFEELENAAGDSLTPLEKSIIKVNEGFSAMQMVAFSVINRITNKVIDLGEQIIKSFTLDPVLSGFQKYEQEINSIQAMLNALNESTEGDTGGLNFAVQEDKLKYLEKGFESIAGYSDETSVSVTAMVNSMSKLMTTGVKMEDSIDVIYGIAALIASTGQNASSMLEDVTGVISKVLGRSFQALDYYSLSSRGLLSKEFINTLLEEESKLSDGNIIKGLDGKYYIKESKNAASVIAGNLAAGIGSGVASGISSGLQEINSSNFKDLGSTNVSGKAFENALSLQYGSFWNPLKKYLDETNLGATQVVRILKKYGKAFDSTGAMIAGNEQYMTDAIDELKHLLKYVDITADLRAELTEEQLAELEEANKGIQAYAESMLSDLGSADYNLSRTAFINLQLAKTYSEATEAVRNSVTAVWSDIYKAIVGDQLKATDRWTDFTEWLFEIFVYPFQGIRDTIKTWAEESGDELLWGSEGVFRSIGPMIHSWIDPLNEAIASVFGFIDENGNYDSSKFAEILTNIANKLKEIVTALTLTEEEQTGVYSGASLIISAIKSAFELLGALWRVTKPIRKLFRQLLNIVISLASGVADFVTALLSGSEAFKEFGKEIGLDEKTLDAFYGTIGMLSVVFDSLVSTVQTLLTKISNSGVLQKVVTLFGSVLAIVADIGTQILGTINDIITAIDSAFSDDGVLATVWNIIDSIFNGFDLKDESGNIVKSIGLNDIFKKILSYVRDGILGIFGFVHGILTGSGAKEGAGSIEKAISDFGAKIYNIFSDFSFGSLVEKLSAIILAVFDILWDVVEYSWNRAEPILNSIVNFVKRALDPTFIAKLGEALVSLGIGLSAVGAGISLIRGWFPAVGPLNRLAEAIDDFAMSLVYKQRAEIVKSAMFGLAATLGAVAAIIMSIGATLLMIRKATENLSESEINNLFGNLIAIMAILMVGITAMIIAVMKLGNLTSKFSLDFFTGASPEGHLNRVTPELMPVVGIILSVAALMLSVAWALNIVSKIPVNDVWRSFGIISLTMTVVLGGIAGLIILVGRFANMRTATTGAYESMAGVSMFGGASSTRAILSNSNNGMYSIPAMILSIGAMMAIVAWALKTVSDIKYKDAWRSFGVLSLTFGIMIGGIVALLAMYKDSMSSISKFGFSKSGGITKEYTSNGLSQIAGLILVMSFSLLLIAKALKHVSNLGDKAWIGIVGLAGILIIIFGGILLILKAMKGIDAAKLELMTKMIKSISRVFAAMALHVVAISAMVLVIYGVVNSLAKEINASNWKKYAIIGGVIIGFIVLMDAICYGLIALASKMDESKLAKVKTVIGLVSLILVIMTAMVAIFGIMAAKLADVPWNGVLKLLSLISILIAAGFAMWGLTKVFQNVKIGILGLVILAMGSLTTMAYCIAKVAEILNGTDWSTIGKFAAYIGVVMGILAILAGISAAAGVWGAIFVAVMAVFSGIMVLGSIAMLNFAKSIEVLAKGIDSFNGIKFDGFKEFILILYDLSTELAKIMLLWGIVSDITGGQSVVAFIGVAAAIAIAATAVKKLVDAMDHLLVLLTEFGKDGAIWTKAKGFVAGFLNVINDLIFGVLAIVLNAVAQAGNLITVAAVTILKGIAESEAVYSIGYYISDLVIQLVEGLTWGLLDGVIGFINDTLDIFYRLTGDTQFVDDPSWHIPKPSDYLSHSPGNKVGSLSDAASEYTGSLIDSVLGEADESGQNRLTSFLGGIVDTLGGIKLDTSGILSNTSETVVQGNLAAGIGSRTYTRSYNNSTTVPNVTPSTSVPKDVATRKWNMQAKKEEAFENKSVNVENIIINSYSADAKEVAKEAIDMLNDKVRIGVESLSD